MNKYTYIYMCIHTYICTCIYVSIYMYIYHVVQTVGGDGQSPTQGEKPRDAARDGACIWNLDNLCSLPDHAVCVYVTVCGCADIYVAYCIHGACIGHRALFACCRCIYMAIYIHINMYIYMYIYVYMYIYIYICMYTCIYIYIHMI